MSDILNIERLKDMPELKRQLLLDMWETISGKCKVGDDWREYKSEFIYQGKTCIVTCQFKIRSIREKQHLTYRNWAIEQKQIVLDAQDVLRGVVKHGQ